MGPKVELFILYQMGNSEEWTWFSPIGVFLSEAALRDYARLNGIASDLRLLAPSRSNEVILMQPQEYVAVKSKEGEVPDVELAEQLEGTDAG